MSDHRDFARIFSKYGYVGVRKIGEGAHGMAILVEDKERTRAVCKMVNLGRATEKEIRAAKKEANLLARLKNPYIVRYRTFFLTRGWFGIVMDYCNCGDLHSRIKSAASEKRSLLDADVLKWFTQAVLALQYLHEKRVMHRDLKPANLFLTGTSGAEDLLVGDFGISKVLPSDISEARTMLGTPYYCAPEVIQGQGYTWSADIWSLGCILFQMVGLRVPFEARNLAGLVQQVCSDFQPTMPASSPSGTADLVHQMLQRDPSARPSTESLVKHSALKDWISKLTNVGVKQTTTAKYEILDQFRQFDLDGDGVIERHEIAAVLKHIDATIWTDASIDALLSSADCNSDGRIQFDEFVQWLFGSDTDGMAPAHMVQRLLQVVVSAIESGLLTAVRDKLVRCRQAIDIGCLRISPPSVCEHVCHEVARQARLLLPRLAEAEESLALDLSKQLLAVVHAVEQLLEESSRQQVLRLAVASSAASVRAFCLELASGRRVGRAPGFSEEALLACAARWYCLDAGERLLEISGFNLRKPMPRDKEGPPVEACVSYLKLTTNRFREWEWGSKSPAMRGARFHFQAPAGEEIQDIVFEDGVCKGIRCSPCTVRWLAPATEQVAQAFRGAAEVVMEAFAQASWRMGAEQGKYAALEARRLGLPSFMPEAVAATRLARSKSLDPPKHWTEEVPKEELQALIDETWSARPVGDGLAPSGLRLAKVERVRSLPSWSVFLDRQVQIAEELKSGGAVKNLMIHRRLPALACDLDNTTGTAWLFHGGPAAVAMASDPSIVDLSFVDNAQDGSLYGRGLYFTECSSRADRLSRDCGAEGLHCLLLCRVVLGRALPVEACLPDVVGLLGACVGGPNHSVIGRGRRRGAHQEFVVYDVDQVYPEFIIWYSRSYEPV